MPIDLDVDETELKSLIALGRKYKWATGDVRKQLETGGVQLARSDFYSDVPSLEDVENSFEYQNEAPNSHPSAVFFDSQIFNLEEMLEFCSDVFAAADSFSAPFEGEQGFFWKNTQFSGLDALAYYGMIKQMKPKRVVEIGSGFSTHIAHQALSELDGERKLVCIDPNPRTEISQISGVRFKRDIIQNVPVESLFSELEAGDIVFYDGSHTVKTGSDTVYFYLKILPYLPAGVYVHAHDVRLPYPRNKKAITEAKISWGEQYLLMAHLHNTQRYKVRLANAFLAEQAREEMDKAMSGRMSTFGVSLWFEILE